MRTIALALGLACVLVVIAPVVALAVNIPDTHLEQALRDAIIPHPTGPITPAQMETLTSFNAQGAEIVNLEGLQYATNLTDLDLGNNSISNITPLQNLPHLTYLSLSANPISDVGSLSGITTLTWLNLSFDSIDSGHLAPLGSLTHLTWLGLAWNHITDLTPLSALTDLGSLDLSNNEITVLTPLSTLTNLSQLWLGYNGITDIAPLSALTTLGTLDLSNNGIVNIGPVDNLTNLMDLDLSNNYITVMTPVGALTSLEILDLSNNEIAVITALNALTNLANLDLSNNEITDMTPLTGLTSIENLELNDNGITDIGPVSTLTNLIVLGLSNNGIVNLEPVHDLTHLVDLFVANNLIGDITPLQNLTHLEMIDLSTNAIYDITPLQNLAPEDQASLEFTHNWIDLSSGSANMATIFQLEAAGGSVTYEPQGVVTGHVHSSLGNGLLSGVNVTVAGGPTGTSNSGGSYSLSVMPAGAHTITFSKPPYYYDTILPIFIGVGTTYVLDATLVPRPIQLPLGMHPSPLSSPHGFKLKKGVAKFTLSVVLTDARGAVTGKTVWLQKSTNGTKWSNLYKVTTNLSGKASKTLSIKKKGTTYYRWSSAATLYDNARVTAKQKVVVK